MPQPTKVHHFGDNYWENVPGRGWVFRRKRTRKRRKHGLPAEIGPDGKPVPLTGRNRKPWVRAMRGKPCFYCGDPADTVDHLTPLSRGGENRQKNCVPACHVCNQKKGALTYDEFMLKVKSGEIRLKDGETSGSPAVAE